jgi:DNA-binding CsgD family transcriptional regulator
MGLKRLSGFSYPSVIEILTPRQRQVLELTRQGKSCKEIGAALQIKPDAVVAQRAFIRRKLQGELAYYARLINARLIADAQLRLSR